MVLSLPQTETAFLMNCSGGLLISLRFSLHSSGTPQYSPSSLSYATSLTASEPLPLPELSSAASTPFPISVSTLPASPEIQGDLPIAMAVVVVVAR